MVYPLTAQGFMKLGYGKIKVMPNLDKGVLMFALLYLIETKELLEVKDDESEDY